MDEYDLSQKNHQNPINKSDKKEMVYNYKIQYHSQYEELVKIQNMEAQADQNQFIHLH